MLPVSASGVGTISQRALAAAIVGNPSKVYDATTTATLASANYSLTGFVGGDSATVTKTAGTYDSANAGARTVSTTLAAGDFSGAGGTLLSNYVLPVSASGVGTISQKALSISITGNPTKAYDGTTAATLAPANYSLSGLVGSETFTVNQTVGTYDSADAGARTVSAALAAGNFVGTNGGQISNYSFAPTATGVGTISQQALVFIGAIVIGNPTKTYDGNTTATLTAENFKLSGFVGSDGATVTKTTGTYDSATAGTRTVSTSLTAGDFLAAAGTNLANYVLPTSASGVGTINPKALVATILGNPTKTYDATTTATLAAANYNLSGFVGGDSATVTKTAGIYDSANAGARTVSTTLAAGDFTATGGVNLGNYILPTSATGVGTINPRALTAAINGTPTRAYDGTAAAVLTAANFGLTGFVAGEGATVTRTAGTYDGVDAGSRNVSTTLTGTDFAAGAGTNLNNYVLPTSASGLGRIDARALTLSLSGDYSKTYDGNRTGTVAPGTLTLAGFAAGEGGSVSAASGSYDSADAGARIFSVLVAQSDYVLTGGAKASNYVLPTSASLAATINRRVLSADITGSPTRTYDGTNVATLTAADFRLTGFVAGQGASVTQTRGTYASADAGQRAVTAGLGAGDFTAQGDTRLSNYILPTTAAGVGRVSPAVLTASIVGNPTKAFDGNTSATLNTGNFALSGLVSGQSIGVTQTSGTYDAETPGARTVTAGLLGGNFVPAVGVSLSNYVLPTLATGAGTINASTSGDPVKDILVGLGVPEDEANATSQQAAFAGGTPRVYIPFPAPGSLSTLRSNGLAVLPGILDGQSGRSASGLQSGLSTVESGAPVINGSDSILLQGSRSKRWTIFVPMASGPAGQDAGDR